MIITKLNTTKRKRKLNKSHRETEDKREEAKRGEEFFLRIPLEFFKTMKNVAAHASSIQKEKP